MMIYCYRLIAIEVPLQTQYVTNKKTETELAILGMFCMCLGTDFKLFGCVRSGGNVMYLYEQCYLYHVSDTNLFL